MFRGMTPEDVGCQKIFLGSWEGRRPRYAGKSGIDWSLALASARRWRRRGRRGCTRSIAKPLVKLKRTNTLRRYGPRESEIKHERRRMECVGRRMEGNCKSARENEREREGKTKPTSHVLQFSFFFPLIGKSLSITSFLTLNYTIYSIYIELHSTPTPNYFHPSMSHLGVVVVTVRLYVEELITETIRLMAPSVPIKKIRIIIYYFIFFKKNNSHLCFN